MWEMKHLTEPEGARLVRGKYCLSQVEIRLRKHILMRARRGIKSFLPEKDIFGQNMTKAAESSYSQRC